MTSSLQPSPNQSSPISFASSKTYIKNFKTSPIAPNTSVANEELKEKITRVAAFLSQNRPLRESTFCALAEALYGKEYIAHLTQKPTAAAEQKISLQIETQAGVIAITKEYEKNALAEQIFHDLTTDQNSPYYGYNPFQLILSYNNKNEEIEIQPEQKLKKIRSSSNERATLIVRVREYISQKMVSTNTAYDNTPLVTLMVNGKTIHLKSLSNLKYSPIFSNRYANPGESSGHICFRASMPDTSGVKIYIKEFHLSRIERLNGWKFSRFVCDNPLTAGYPNIRALLHKLTIKDASGNDTLAIPGTYNGSPALLWWPNTLITRDSTVTDVLNEIKRYNCILLPDKDRKRPSSAPEVPEGRSLRYELKNFFSDKIIGPGWSYQDGFSILTEEDFKELFDPPED